MYYNYHADRREKKTIAAAYATIFNFKNYRFRICNQRPLKIPDTNVHENQSIFTKIRWCHLCRHFEFFEFNIQQSNKYHPDTNFFDSKRSYKEMIIIIVKKKMEKYQNEFSKTTKPLL